MACTVDGRGIASSSSDFWYHHVRGVPQALHWRITDLNESLWEGFNWSYLLENYRNFCEGSKCETQPIVMDIASPPLPSYFEHRLKILAPSISSNNHTTAVYQLRWREDEVEERATIYTWLLRTAGAQHVSSLAKTAPTWVLKETCLGYRHPPWCPTQLMTQTPSTFGVSENSSSVLSSPFHSRTNKQSRNFCNLTVTWLWNDKLRKEPLSRRKGITAVYIRRNCQFPTLTLFSVTGGNLWSSGWHRAIQSKHFYPNFDASHNEKSFLSSVLRIWNGYI